MSEVDPFEDAPRQKPQSDEEFRVDVTGFEGPLDLLLVLARQEKVDLAKIQILPLAEQYLEFVARAKSLKIELAADFLVMAAWLAWLKSRLIAPQEAGVEHLKALALISRTMRDASTCQKLRANTDPAALHAILTESQATKAA